MPSRSALGHVEPLAAAQLPAVRALLDDAAVHCFAEARLVPQNGAGDAWGLPTMLGYFQGRHLSAALILGANLVPVTTGPDARQAFAESLIRMGRRCSSIVGPAQEVLPLWDLLEAEWGPAREVRADQPLLVMGHRSPVAPDPLVEPVPLHRLDDFLPSAIAMFVEEVGVDPRAGGMDQLYRQRVGELLAAGRAFARWEDGRVVFKAELGAVSERAVQVQGVWVDPDHRGRGLSEPGMAAVVRHSLRLAPLVSLYVNSYNVPALAAYRAVGFRQVATFATVLF